MTSTNKSTGFSSVANLFPNRFSFFIFWLYVSLFVGQGILVTATKNASGTGYSYNTSVAVVVTEGFKLLAAIILYTKDHSISQLLPDAIKSYKVFLRYFIPAGLYCLYNNLGFVNLSYFDPTTYYLLLQFRVVVTGFVFQILFKKKLSLIQWASLGMLTAGCIVKELGHSMNMSDSNKTAPSTSDVHNESSMHWHVLLILAQVLSSCMAGVYNEYLLKDQDADVHIMLQNIYMYVASIICGCLVLIFQYRGQVASTHVLQDFGQVLTTPTILLVVVNNAAIGIVTSQFLKALNSLLKNFASAIELMFTAVLCWIIFNIPVDLYTIISIAIVTAAILLYAQNPVNNAVTKPPVSEVPKPAANSSV